MISQSQHTTLESLCHVAESGELRGDFCNSRFMCSENSYNRLIESVLQRLWREAEDLRIYRIHFLASCYKSESFVGISKFKLIYNPNSIGTKVY
jgi:hypothetical protein